VATSGLCDAADQLSTSSRTARNLTTVAEERVEVIEGGVGEVRRRVQGTAENVERTGGALDEVELGSKLVYLRKWTSVVRNHSTLDQLVC